MMCFKGPIPGIGGDGMPLANAIFVVLLHALVFDAPSSYGFNVFSNSSQIRRYSSYHASGWVKPCRSSG